MCYDCQQGEIKLLTEGKPPLTRAQAELFLQSRAKETEGWSKSEVMLLDEAEISAAMAKLKDRAVITKHAWFTEPKKTIQDLPKFQTKKPLYPAYPPLYQQQIHWEMGKGNGKTTLMKHLVAYQHAIQEGKVFKTQDPEQYYVLDDLEGKVPFDGTAYGYYQVEMYLTAKEVGWTPGSQASYWSNPAADPYADIQSWKSNQYYQTPMPHVDHYETYDDYLSAKQQPKKMTATAAWLVTVAAEHLKSPSKDMMLAQHYVFKLTGNQEYAPLWKKTFTFEEYNPLTSLDMPKNLAVSPAQAKALERISEHLDYLKDALSGYMGYEAETLRKTLQHHARIVLGWEAGTNEDYPL